MSQKNPYKQLGALKADVRDDADAKSAAREMKLELDALRPRTRADCLAGGINEQRPCPWYGCSEHLGLDINPETGSMQVRDVDSMVHTCTLDVAEIGGEPGSGVGDGVTLEEIGEITNLTRERIRQIELRGMLELRPILIRRGLGQNKTDGKPK